MEEKEKRLMTLAEVQQRVDTIAAKKAELTARRETLTRRIGSTQTESARRYLAGDAGGVEEIGRLHGEIGVIASAHDLLEIDLRQAELDLSAAKARDFREQAAQKKTDLERLNETTAKVLANLSALEGITYSHSILSSQPLAGAWLQWGTISAPLEFQGVPELQLNVPAPDKKIAVPRSRRLRMEIEDLEQQADEIEHQLRQSQPALAT